MDNGFLLPTYHQFYWMGANVSDAIYWPNFTWVDPYTPGPINSSYEHWGRFQPGQEPEPNFCVNNPPELCVGGNYSQAYFNPLAWGWADDYCLNKHPFMCKMLREWHALGCWPHVGRSCLVQQHIYSPHTRLRLLAAGYNDAGI